MANPGQSTAVLAQTTTESTEGGNNVAIHLALATARAKFGRQIASGAFKQDEATAEHVVRR